MAMEQEPCITIEQDIVIAGAGIAGLATALQLHRCGIGCLVLESSDMLRITGFALTLWTNAWRALDVLGVGHALRDKSLQIHGFQVASPHASTESSPAAAFNIGEFESRCVRRQDLLETLATKLPQGTIRYSSKIVSIQKSGSLKLVHLADGSFIKTKVLIGCDGVNSIVAKWLGLQDPVNIGCSAIRGFVNYPDGHGFQAKFHTYFGGGLRFGCVPNDDRNMYWFCTFNPSVFKYDVNNNSTLKMKQFVLINISNAPKHVSDVVERTGLDSVSCVPLKIRLPWKVLFANIVKDNVCVLGDALHPMTPDLGQGGCSALEDSVVLACCIAEALGTNSTLSGTGKEEGYDSKIEIGLQKYANDRKWRSFGLISMAYIVGWVQEKEGVVMRGELQFWSLNSTSSSILVLGFPVFRFWSPFSYSDPYNVRI